MLSALCSGHKANQRAFRKHGGVELLVKHIAYNPEETLENFRPAISRTYYVALEHFRSEIAETGTFFRRLADAAVEGDSERLQRVIQDFGEHQRHQVLSILTEETA